jgi:hypothetical protein
VNETGIGGQANAKELEDGNEKKSSDILLGQLSHRYESE